MDDCKRPSKCTNGTEEIKCIEKKSNILQLCRDFIQKLKEQLKFASLLLVKRFLQKMITAKGIKSIDLVESLKSKPQEKPIFISNLITFHQSEITLKIV